MLSERATARIAGIQDEAKGFLIGTLLLRIYECARMLVSRTGSRQLRHITLIKSASMLLRDSPSTPSSAEALETFERMILEMSEYGEGVIIDDEFPARLSSNALQANGLQIIHRLARSEDRKAVCAAMGLDRHDASQLMTLKPGHALVLAEGMDEPLEVEMQLSTVFRILGR
jgi:hypothetical protein